MCVISGMRIHVRQLCQTQRTDVHTSRRFPTSATVAASGIFRPSQISPRFAGRTYWKSAVESPLMVLSLPKMEQIILALISPPKPSNWLGSVSVCLGCQDDLKLQMLKMDYHFQIAVLIMSIALA